MRKSIFTLLSVVVTVFTAGIALAATGPEPKIAIAAMGIANTVTWATALGMSFAAGLCGIAQAMGLKAACEGLARNPEAAGKLQTLLILGMAFIESLAIYALVINLILLFVNPFV